MNEQESLLRRIFSVGRDLSDLTIALGTLVATLKSHPENAAKRLREIADRMRTVATGVDMIATATKKWASERIVVVNKLKELKKV